MYLHASSNYKTDENSSDSSLDNEEIVIKLHKDVYENHTPDMMFVVAERLLSSKYQLSF